jgi:hypothetical protein
MAVLGNAPPPVEAAQPTAAWLGENPATTASIAAYLEAGERMRGLLDVTWKLCAVLIVLVLLAWAFGLLPGAVKLF